MNFWEAYFWPGFWMVLTSLLAMVVLLVIVAFLLYGDRKIWAAVQSRRGPNVVGPFGLLQSFADLLKFVLKEPIIPSSANKGVFLLAPLVATVLALAAWAVVPVHCDVVRTAEGVAVCGDGSGWVIANINVGILYIFAISSLAVYGVIMGGWASNSKYPFMGSLRKRVGMTAGWAGSYPSSASSTGSGCRCSRCS